MHNTVLNQFISTSFWRLANYLLIATGQAFALINLSVYCDIAVNTWVFGCCQNWIQDDGEWSCGFDIVD